MAINRTTEVMTKCFLKSYRVEVHAVLDVLDLDLISKTEALHIFYGKSNISGDLWLPRSRTHYFKKSVGFFGQP